MERVCRMEKFCRMVKVLQDGEGWKFHSGRQSHHMELLVLLGSCGSSS